MTGKLPQKAESAPAKEPEKDSTSAAKPAETAPASEAGKEQPKSRKTADDRKQELSGEIKTLLERRGVLKDDEFWAEFEEYRKNKGAKAAEPPTATTKPEIKEPEAPKRPIRPKLLDFQSDIPKWEAAMEKYEDELLEYPARKAAFEAAKASAEKSKQDSEKRMREGIERVNEKYPDAPEVGPKVFQSLMDARAQIPEVMWFLNNTEVLPDMLYALGGQFKLEEFIEQAHASPAKAIRLLATMENDIVEALKNGKKSEEPAAKEEQAEPPKVAVTKAGKPPGEVSAKGTVTEDPSRRQSQTTRRAMARK